jgi:hypothetical protein
MTESKVSATDRLRRDGRWNEASEFRDRARKELRASGMNRSLAAEEAWVRMIAEYPASEAEAGEESSAEPDWPVGFTEDDEQEALESISGKLADFDRDFVWAYSQLGKSDLTPRDAPSAPAWFLLKYANSARSEFLKRAATFFERRESKAEAEQAMFDDHRKQMSFIDAIYDEFGPESPASEDMARQASSDFLAEELRSRGWQVQAPEPALG